MERLARLARTVRREARRHGLGKAVCAAFLRFVGRHERFNVLQLHHCDQVDFSLLECPDAYAGSFLAPRALEHLAGRSPDIPTESLRYSLAKGDKCYGFVRDGALRAYSWYASTPTRISPELRVHFSASYIYVYRAFTSAMDRGKRLFPVGMTRALQLYLGAGYRGMLLYVNAHNLESRTSCLRMGFRPCGLVFIGRFFGRYFIWATPACARFGFRVEAIAGGVERDDVPHIPTTRPSV